MGMMAMPHDPKTTRRFSWRIRLGIWLAAHNPFGLKQVGRWMIWGEIVRMSPNLSDMERNIRFRRSAEEVLSESGLKG